MNSPAAKRPGNEMAYAALGALLLVALAGAYAVIELGHRYGSDDAAWIPGNPVLIVFRYITADDREWTFMHTGVLVLIIAVLIALGVVLARAARSDYLLKNHIDSKAKLLGKGKTMTLKNVTAENSKAGYTTADVVGMHLAKLVLTGEDLYAGWRSTLLAIMGTGSGKTSALAIPNAWNAPGWVYGTSNKRDFTDPIWGFREKRGKVRVFDPQQIAEAAPDWYWDPLSNVTDDVHAKILASLWADAGSKSPEAAATDPFWEQQGRDLVAGLALAAAMGGRPVTELIAWVNKPNRDDPVQLLLTGRSIAPGRPYGWVQMASDLQGKYDMPHETKRGVFANAAKILSFLVNESAKPWISKIDEHDTRPAFDPHEFVQSTGDTLISLSKEGVGTLGPLVASLTTAVMEAAEDYAKRCPGGRMPVPGVFILDEAANVVRIHDLPDKYSHYASRGLYIVTILQSYAQGEAVWGQTGMNKLMGAATHVMVGRGIKDEKFLKQLSELIGTHDELHYSTGTSSGSVFSNNNSSGNRSVNSSYRTVPIMSVAEIHALPEWRAMIFASGESPVLVELVPHFRNPGSELAIAARESEAKYGTPTAVTV